LTTAFLSLGSNVEPKKNILKAIELLAKRVRILKSSTVYLSEPLREKSQPKYLNLVVKIETDIEPRKLKFEVLRVIEAQLGRRRTEEKYASRTIDIDLLVYDDLHLSEKDLVVPDPEIEERAFLAIPLCEIEPELVLPGSNRAIKEMAKAFRKPEITELRSTTEAVHRLIRSLSM
jgi:2-amino-4-hydroxy-6-hydroxymethyldihydropteridine diphosphokinase